MAGWRYFAERLNGDGTGTLIEPNLPLSSVSIDLALSEPDSIDAEISPEYSRLLGPDGLPIISEWSTAIYAECDGDIKAGGIVVRAPIEKSSLSLEVVGFAGYPKDLPYVGSGEFFIETDTLDIFRSIWGHIQSQPGGNLGLTFDQTKSGRRVGKSLASEEYDPEGGPGGLELETQAYKLAWYQDHDLLSNLDGLAADSPFDYRESHRFRLDGTIAHHLSFGVPNFGRRREDLRFAIGENVLVTPSVERDGDEYANEVYVLGAGEGSAMIRGRATHPRDGRLRRVKTISNSSLRATSVAAREAARELQWRTRLENLDTIVVADTPHAPVGSVQPGDEIYLTGQGGWAEIDDWFVVLAVHLAPESSDAMELSVRRADRLA